MFKHILLPTDGSELAAKGVKQAIKTAKALGARITSIYVAPNYRVQRGQEGYYMPQLGMMRKILKDQAAAHAKEILAGVKAAADKAGVECDTVVAVGYSPYAMIIKHAKASKCDLIMMASHGRSGVQRLLLGSETAKVLAHSKIPVLVVR